MNIEKIKTAKKETLRFLDKLSIFENAIKDNKYTSGYPKESGALKRAILDLTRALSEMRKPG